VIVEGRPIPDGCRHTASDGTGAAVGGDLAPHEPGGVQRREESPVRVGGEPSLSLSLHLLRKLRVCRSSTSPVAAWSPVSCSSGDHDRHRRDGDHHDAGCLSDDLAQRKRRSDTAGTGRDCVVIAGGPPARTRMVRMQLESSHLVVAIAAVSSPLDLVPHLEAAGTGPASPTDSRWRIEEAGTPEEESRLLQYFSKTWAHSGGTQGIHEDPQVGRKRWQFKHLTHNCPPIARSSKPANPGSTPAASTTYLVLYSLPSERRAARPCDRLCHTADR
jgi:hypothetical protein